MQYRPSQDRAILDAIRRIVRVLRESSALAERKVGLSGAQLFVLQNLAAEGTMSVNDLAARTLTHQSSVSVVVKKLVSRGLVSRAVSPDDARRAVLELTPRGRKLLSRAPGAAQERLIAGVQALGSYERRNLARTLTELAAAIDTSEGYAPMFFEQESRR